MNQSTCKQKNEQENKQTVKETAKGRTSYLNTEQYKQIKETDEWKESTNIQNK